MKSFYQYLLEEVNEDKLKHLQHINRLPITGSHDGVARAVNSLEATAKHLTGQETPGHTFKTKIDGAPSVVIGHHPETGQVFVGTKSVFNKEPKLNFSHEDIEANHGHSRGLADKLHDLLDHGPKILPDRKSVGGRFPDQVFQGDFTHSGKKDIETDGDQVKYQPNTVEYSHDKSSGEGKKALAAKIGLAMHTRYKGNDLGSMVATPNVKDSDFKSHPDVHMMSTDFKPNPEHFTPEDQREFHAHKEMARKTYASMKPDALDAIGGHAIPLETYMNGIIRRNATRDLKSKPEEGSVDGYIQHLTGTAQKDMDKVKTQAAKDKRSAALNDQLQYVHQNREHFQKGMDLDKHLANAKNVLVKTMDKGKGVGTSIGGIATGHEGYVHTDDQGNMQKLVDQSPPAEGKPGGFAGYNLAGYGFMSKAKK